MYKQIILARNDLKMSKGKLAAQVAHASVGATLKVDKKTLQNWLNEGMKKVVLKVNDQKEIFKWRQYAEDYRFDSFLVKDAGHTELEPGTITCLAIGPAPEKDLDKHFGEIKLM